jgi:hypothetical protein
MWSELSEMARTFIKKIAPHDDVENDDDIDDDVDDNNDIDDDNNNDDDDGSLGWDLGFLRAQTR